MELVAKEQEGEGTAELQQRLDKLGLEAAKQQGVSASGAMRGRAGHRDGRRAGSTFSSTLRGRHRGHGRVSGSSYHSYDSNTLENETNHDENVSCWPKHLEEMFSSIEKVDDKDKKYDQLQKRCKALEATMRRLELVVNKANKSDQQNSSKIFACLHCEYRSLEQHNVQRHMKAKHEKHPVFGWAHLCDLSTKTNQSIKKLNHTLGYVADVLGHKYFVKDIRGVSINSKIFKFSNLSSPSRS